MSTYFEVARTNAEQPWHARLWANGRIILRSENYSRMVGAERAILSAARTFGYEDPKLTVNVPREHGVPREKVLTALDPSRPWLSVLYVDERVEVTA